MPEPAIILGSNVHMLDSQHKGTTYRITVSLPYSYHESWAFGDTLAQWPVVYLLDANWFYGMVTDIVRSMAWCGSTTDAIVVGIGYPGDDKPQEAWRQAVVRRDADFTPVRSEAREKRIGEMIERPILTGGAAHFHRFIKDELIPFIEQEYHADPLRRILAGHSLGGDFAAFALFEAPDLFDTYIIASCGPGDEDGFIFKQEEAFAKAHQKLPVKVFLAAGELEEEVGNTTLTDTLRLAAILESRNYEGFSLVKRVFPDANHCEVIAPGFQAGLKFALRR
ncbi:MAG: alpha/beta hydrolase-fold protein [Anaerolineae bacterium]